MRTIGLEGMRFHSPLGFHEEEKILGNEMEVTLHVTLNSGSLKEDRLEETLDYTKVHELVKGILSEEMNLLETACSKIISAVIKLSAAIVLVKVKVSKLHPPVTGRIEKVFVEEEWVRVSLSTN